jgi:hypothetical protein
MPNDLLTRGLAGPSLITQGLGEPDRTPNPPNARESVLLEPPVVDPYTYRPLIPGETYDLLQPPDPGRLSINLDAWREDPAWIGSPQDEYFRTFSGSDMRVVLDVQGSGQKPKHLVELNTITVSIHREKAPVRALGYIGPKSFARGRRTIGGTLILTQFQLDFLYRFLGADYTRDCSKDTTYSKIDQLPPFNLTLFFADEYGNASAARVTGVDLVTDGTVFSSNDMLTERSISYVASDFTPLLPLDAVGRQATVSDRRATGAERTPRDVMRESRAQGSV